MQTPALRAPMYVMDNASEPLPCVLREVRIIASQSYSQPCMCVERRNKSVQCAHCVRMGSRGDFPSLPFSLPPVSFLARKKKWVHTPPRRVGAVNQLRSRRNAPPHHGRGKILRACGEGRRLAALARSIGKNIAAQKAAKEVYYGHTDYRKFVRRQLLARDGTKHLHTCRRRRVDAAHYTRPFLARTRAGVSRRHRHNARAHRPYKGACDGP